MTYILKNNDLEIQIDDPLEGYSAARFDWTGKITTVKFQGLPLTIAENIDYVDNAVLGKGFYNEFGITSPLGFEETSLGGWFHKIGVGLLKKEDPEYLFHRTYETRPAKFKVVDGDDHIAITCTSEIVNGYGYVLNKKITLKENGFTIDYTLRNVGQKEIKTDEYVHNFMAINNEFMGSDYILKFPFSLKPALFGEYVNIEEKVVIGENGIGFTGTPNDQFFFSNLPGNERIGASWELQNLKHKVAIRGKADFETDKVNVWGWKHVISPELFYPIVIQPGETSKWSRGYTIFRMA